MEFLKWLIALAERAKPDSALLELSVGLAVLIGASIAVSFKYSLFWLLVTIPVGVMLTLHGYWRSWIRG